ncbi:MAG: hypothetical protein HHAS10_05320 [Candidatus Altimarinota bacterium]
MSLSKVSQVGFYPHDEVKTTINPNFIIKAHPDVTPHRKAHRIPEDVLHHRIANARNGTLWRVEIPRRIGKRLLIVDSNPMAGYEYDYKRRLHAAGGRLGAPTVIGVSLERLYALLDPYFEGYPLLGHAVESIESTRLSIPGRTHGILNIGLKDYDHWNSVLDTTQKGGIVTYDALLRGLRDKKPINNPLYTPGDAENPIIKDRRTNGKTGKAARSSDRLDPSMRRI